MVRVRTENNDMYSLEGALGVVIGRKDSSVAISQEKYIVGLPYDKDTDTKKTLSNLSKGDSLFLIGEIVNEHGFDKVIPRDMVTSPIAEIYLR